ncbi:hypothetical protein C8F04DRAFT_1266946 [Mycena alexandri]|uniref:Uncharacterized protein n=1 Tax=Mycena alexandri TaxID=1745969 RepID=A0AAD6SGH5_9AGAR|nr:hypothetical protein C8F04DRAFT_1266946 [Mycena alexandri]
MDFPAIRSEGGLPGFKSAGIVAFIRKRLVDLGEDSLPPAVDNPDDVKAQRTLGEEDIDEANTFKSLPAAKFEYRELSEPGYILDKFSLLDVDLGSSVQTMSSPSRVVEEDARAKLVAFSCVPTATSPN